MTKSHLKCNLPQAELILFSSSNIFFPEISHFSKWELFKLLRQKIQRTLFASRFTLVYQKSSLALPQKYTRILSLTASICQYPSASQPWSLPWNTVTASHWSSSTQMVYSPYSSQVGPFTLLLKIAFNVNQNKIQNPYLSLQGFI